MRYVMPKIMHFEIAADDPKRAMTFYEKVFGWKYDIRSGLSHINREMLK
jgi:predicted enzyme related to lactoylglutathione lyase